MKKLIIATVFATATSLSMAAEVGIRASHGTTTLDNSAGVTVGLKKGSFGAELGLDRSTTRDTNLTRVTALGTYDVAKVFGATVVAKGGMSYLDRSNGASGTAMVAGVGLQYPLTKTVNATVDYSYQYNQSRVYDLNGPIVTAGIKVLF
jgi:outer membrane autotransporter protein